LHINYTVSCKIQIEQRACGSAIQVSWQRSPSPSAQHQNWATLTDINVSTQWVRQCCRAPVGTDSVLQYQPPRRPRRAPEPGRLVVAHATSIQVLGQARPGSRCRRRGVSGTSTTSSWTYVPPTSNQQLKFITKRFLQQSLVSQNL
jgi:hypothetical protein